MPKIRGFKPDLWTDEDFVELSPFARLLWMGMWNYACDNGHLADKSKQIKMRVLPTDDVNCAELLRELETNGRIVRSEGVITIPNFRKHQKPDKRYFQTCDVPGCCKPDGDSQPETRGAHVEPTSGSPRDHAVGSQGPLGDGDGEVMVKGSDGESGAAGKPRKKPSTRLPSDWTPSDEHTARCVQDGIDINAQVARFRAHAEANDRRQVNWNAAFTQWLLNVPEWQRNQRPATVRSLPQSHEIEQPPDGLSDAEYAAWYANRRRA